RAESFEHASEGGGGALEGAFAQGGEFPVFAGASAANREGVGEPGGDEAFFLEAGEGGVDGADGDVVAGAAFDFLSDGDAVGVLAKVEEGEHDEELELAEAGFGHGTAG